MNIYEEKSPGAKSRQGAHTAKKNVYLIALSL